MEAVIIVAILALVALVVTMVLGKGQSNSELIDNYAVILFLMGLAVMILKILGM